MHLDLPALNNASVHFLASLIGVDAIGEGYKPETLHHHQSYKCMPVMTRQ